MLKELKEIAEEIKKTNSFSLKCGSYNVLDEINKALNELTKEKTPKKPSLFSRFLTALGLK